MNNKVRRLYVEKKSSVDRQSDILLKELQNTLSLSCLTGLRIFVRYDLSGITDEEYWQIEGTVLSEPQTDICYEEELPENCGDYLLAVELLPGQYDQRADSAAQCIQLVTGGEKPLVKAAKIYAFKGSFTENDRNALKHYFINPVDSREAGLNKVAYLEMQVVVPQDVEVLHGFIEMDKLQLQQAVKDWGLAMDEEDLLFCQEYFSMTEQRDPTITEIRMIDTYWSDHCRHTTFGTELKEVIIANEEMQATYHNYLKARETLYAGKKKPLCLMDLATIAAKELKAVGKLQNLDISEEINACSIVVPVDVDGEIEEYLIMFKNETHNHPTEIEPFGGAATCLGGAIRDPLSGRSYVYQAMRITGCGDPTVPLQDTLPGKLPQRRITQQAAAGYSSYGNQIGLATGMVREIYHPGYVAKRLEMGAVIAAAPKENVIRSVPQPGDKIILLGGRTGRDGCGGATGSSKAHTESSLESCGAEVQKGNPPEERKLQRLFRNPKAAKMIKRCNDFGAGGVSVAIGELADGLFIDLDKVPKKYEGLDGTELAISESQERMAVVLSAQDADSFIAMAAEENIEATVVATVTESPRLVLSWRGKEIVNISRAFLNTNGKRKEAKAQIDDIAIDGLTDLLQPQGTTLKERYSSILSDLNICSQQGLVARFDASIGKGTVLMPFGGKYQLTPTESMVAKVAVLNGMTDTATIMAHGYNPYLSCISPYHGAALAIVEAVTKLVAAGGNYRDAYLTLQEFFEKLGNDPKRWGKPFAALLGAYRMQMELGIAAIGGKDSMSGSFEHLDVPPTLIAIAVAPTKASKTVSPELKKVGSDLWLFQPRYENGLPVTESLKENYDFIHSLMQKGLVLSAHTVGFGGIAEALAKMSFGNKIGYILPKMPPNFYQAVYGSIVLEIAPEYAVDLQNKAIYLGKTQEEAMIRIAEEQVALEDLLMAWQKPLESVFPTKALSIVEKPLSAISNKQIMIHSKGKFAAPRIVIPVFPGTNCEYDTARAFEKAGGLPQVVVFHNLNAAAIAESIAALSKSIANAQIVMLPGGFSGGDEPDGSGKFIAAVFRAASIKEEIDQLLQKRDGLMLGICNGFQALVKLGLLPYGEIKQLDDNSPTLTFNTINRHVSQMVQTKICSKLSPWLQGVEVGDIHSVAVSHGEGRFVASETEIKQLIANGQVATQYVDEQGNPTYDIVYNPNQSYHAIEGITSPDGRILGKMGHSERMDCGVFRNIPGNKDQKLFASGVNYFK